LRDRLAAPVPEGLELYLDRADLLPVDWLAQIRAVVARAGAPSDFTWIVEAPTRTLGGEYFDLSADNADARETLRRVVAIGAALGAVAANVHVVAPTRDVWALGSAAREEVLDRTTSLLDFYVAECRYAGVIPQVENVPPVGRMREGAFVYSTVGAAAEDLIALGQCFPELRFTVDISHAALYLSWRRVDPASLAPDLQLLARYCQAAPWPTSLKAFVDQLADRTTTMHVSNASGILGEGLRYGDGDEDLDAALAPLVGRVPYLVTETLEPDDDHAVGMRQAQARLIALRSAVSPGVPG
jgi:hypothetical protein